MWNSTGIRCGSANKLLYDEVKEKDNMKKKNMFYYARYDVKFKF